MSHNFLIQENWFSPFLKFFKTYRPFFILLLLVFSILVFNFFKMPKTSTPESSPAMEKFHQVEAISKSEDGTAKIMAFFKNNPQLVMYAVGFNFFFLLLFLIGLGLHARSFYLLFNGKKILKEEPNDKEVGWGVRHVILFLILIFSASVLLATFEKYVYLRFDQIHLLSKDLLLLFHTLIIDTSAFYFMWYLSEKKISIFNQEVGLYCQNIWKEIKIGLLTYCWVVPVFIGLVILIGLIIKLFHYEPPPHTLVDILVVADKKNSLVVALSLFLACVIGPIMEEVFFRGFFYKAFRKRCGVKLALFASSSLFAYVHMSLFAFFPILFLGYVLGYLAEKRKNLWASITMHVLHNSLLMGYFFIIKRGVIDQLPGAS